MRVEIRIIHDYYLPSVIRHPPTVYNVPVSAEAKLIPTPPALVVRRKMKKSESGALNASIDFCR